jgi:hypothetical protein
LVTTFHTVRAGSTTSRRPCIVTGSTLSGKNSRRGIPGARGRSTSNGGASAE